MWHPGATGRQPCGLQKNCPDADADLGAGFTFLGSFALAPVTAKTIAPTKINFVVIAFSPLIFCYTKHAHRTQRDPGRQATSPLAGSEPHGISRELPLPRVAYPVRLDFPA